MIGHDDPVRAQRRRFARIVYVEDALDDERPVPQLTDLAEIAPLDRRIEVGTHPAHIVVEAAGVAEHGFQIAEPVRSTTDADVPRPAGPAHRLNHALHWPVAPRHAGSRIAVADAGPADIHVPPTRLSECRTLLTSNSLFTFEKIDLAPSSAWCLEAKRETWLLVVSGSARASLFDLAMGDAVFAQLDRINIRAGAAGLSALLAYTGGLVPELLQCADMETIQ